MKLTNLEFVIIFCFVIFLYPFILFIWDKSDKAIRRINNQNATIEFDERELDKLEEGVYYE